MIKVLTLLLSLFKHWMAVVSHAWQDVRVPTAARIMVASVPLYFLCPCDLNWDFLPGGYLDDIWIAVSLVTMALRMTPRAVFGDARKAMTLGALGIFLTVGTANHFSKSLSANLDSSGMTEIASANLPGAGSLKIGGKPIGGQSSADASTVRSGAGNKQLAIPPAKIATVQAIAASSTARPPILQARQSQVKTLVSMPPATEAIVKTADISTSKMPLNRAQPAPVFWPPGHTADAKHYSPAIAQARATFVSLSFLLTWRGGNFQLYACNGGSFLMDALLANSQITSRRHRFEGGYLFEALDRLLITSEAPC